MGPSSITIRYLFVKEMFLQIVIANFQCCIRVKNGGSYIKKEEMQQQMIGGIPSVLSIEDPLTPSNDIGKSSYGAPQVKAAFEYAHRVLSRAITPQAQYHTNDSILSKLILVTEQVSEYRKWIKDSDKFYDWCP